MRLIMAEKASFMDNRNGSPGRLLDQNLKLRFSK